MMLGYIESLCTQRTEGSSGFFGHSIRTVNKNPIEELSGLFLVTPYNFHKVTNIMHIVVTFVIA